MNRRLSVTTGLAVCVLGALLCLVRADQQFILLAPTEGVAHMVPLTHDAAYTQEFVVYQDTVSAFALYVRPLGRNLSAEPVQIELRDGQTIVSSQSVPAVFLDSSSPIRLSVTPPYPTERGQRLTVAVAVPASLSGKVGLQMRAQDESFAAGDAVFYINEKAQESPLAYEVYRQTVPVLPLQAGGLLVLAGLWAILPVALRAALSTRYVFIIALVILYSVPLFIHSAVPVPLILTQILVAVGMMTLLRRYKLSEPAVMVGSLLFAFTTWWAAHVLEPGAVFDALSIKDALLDPNQTLVSHAGGSYLGIPALLLAGIGVVGTASRFKVLTAVGLAGGLLAFLPSIALPHVLIIPVFVICWFSAFGMEALYTFIGRQNRLSALLMVALTVITLLDLYTVGATTLQSTLLPYS